MGSPRLTFTRLTRRGPAPSLTQVSHKKWSQSPSACRDAASDAQCLHNQLTQPSTSEVTPPVSKAVSPLPVCLHSRFSGQETGDMIQTIEFISPQLGSSSPHPHICYSPGCRRQSSNSWSTSSLSMAHRTPAIEAQTPATTLVPYCHLQGRVAALSPHFDSFISDNIDRVTPRFSGMSLGDVMKVTVMQEMEQLNMERSKPLDLSCKAISFSMKN